MSLFLGKRRAIDLPPPPIDPKDTDRFGLPLWFTLLEYEAARKARLEKAGALVRDATEAVIRQVGRAEARLLFLDALRTPPRGKQANAKENALLLTAYDRALARGVPARRAARVAADEMATGRNDDVETFAKRIRELVKKRAGLEETAGPKNAPTTLLGRLVRNGGLGRRL